MIDSFNLIKDQDAGVKNNVKSLELLSFLGVLLFIALIYSPILVNAFNGDDFVHLKWLSQAVEQPELIWRNFHSAWLDITTAKFYRPLISLFMLLDYSIWKVNGIGFHLTNVICHLANTFLVWLIIRQLTLNKDNSKLNYMWCLSSAILFGLYPLHPEAVSWITGRVDTFVTLFSLISLYGYMRWSQTDNSRSLNSWFFIAFISMALALLCKEMAIILPAVFCAYEFFIAASPLKILPRCLLVFRYTGTFWLLLVFYFALRYYALGTLMGGYDNAGLSAGNLSLIISNWRRSLLIFLFPFNPSLIAKRTFFMFFWGALLAGNFLLVLKYVFKRGNNFAIFAFLLSWLLISLIPVYKLFNISADLQGSRLAYLPSVPLCALLCFGYANFLEIKGRLQCWKMLALIFLLSIAGSTLLANNLAWIKAECSSQAILSELNNLSKDIGANCNVYIIGLPDQINGAYVCRNALDGMSKYPQVSKSISHCFNLDEINRVFPFGYARNAMNASDSAQENSRFYTWNSSEQKLQNFFLPLDKLDLPLVLEAKKDFSKQDSEILVGLKDKFCFDLDYLIVSVNQENFNSHSTDFKFFQLFYTNDVFPQFDNSHKLDVPLKHGQGVQRLIFPLHGQVDWALGNKAHQLKLLMPRSRDFSIVQISFESANKIMPILSFKANGNQNALGFIELSSIFPTCNLAYDGRQVLGVDNIELEITEPNQTFAVLNDTGDTNLVTSRRKLKGLFGLLSLNKKDFPAPGIYELRLRAFDRDNKPVGAAGDHIVITVK